MVLTCNFMRQKYTPNVCAASFCRGPNTENAAAQKTFRYLSAMENWKQILGAVAVGLLALFVGGITNMGIVQAGSALWPVDPQFDLKTMAGLEAALPTYTTVQLLIPVLAHAAGTLVAALIVARWGLWPVFSAYFFAGLFFLGGLQMVVMLPAPLWMEMLDLTLAYFPMAWLALRTQKKQAAQG